MRVESEAILDIKNIVGRFEITLKQVPIPTVPEANVGWNLPTLESEMSDEHSHIEHTLGPGTYAVVLKNDHSGTSSAQVNLTLRSNVEFLCYVPALSGPSNSGRFPQVFYVGKA